MADKTTKTPKIDADMVRQLADLLEETGLTEIEYGNEQMHLRVAKGGVPMANVVSSPVAAPAATTVTETLSGGSEDDAHASHPGVVVSPMVGTAYTGADPESPPFVKVGDEVKEGDTLLLIEAMKVFNPIKAANGGKVSRILISSGTPVEFGEPLMIIE